MCSIISSIMSRHTSPESAWKSLLVDPPQEAKASQQRLNALYRSLVRRVQGFFQFFQSQKREEKTQATEEYERLRVKIIQIRGPYYDNPHQRSVYCNGGDGSSFLGSTKIWSSCLFYCKSSFLSGEFITSDKLLTKACLKGVLPVLGVKRDFLCRPVDTLGGRLSSDQVQFVKSANKKMNPLLERALKQYKQIDLA